MNNQKMNPKSVGLCLVLSLVSCAASAAWGQTSLLEVFASADSIRCHGDDNGELFWQITGGVAPYEYEWRRVGNSFVFAGGSQDANGLAGPVGGNLEANTYELTIIDADGITAIDTVEIGEPAPLLVLAIEVADARCSDSCDGWIDMTVGGGTGALVTSWSDGFSGSASRQELCADEYIFFLRDERGCQQKGLIEIAAPPAIETMFELESPSCSGAVNGTISAIASGGVGELEYHWSNGVNLADLSNITSGVYTLTVTDAENCTSVIPTELPEGPPMQANVLANYGCGDGRILVSTSPINGTGPYNYEWSIGSFAPVLVQMSSGNYSLSLTDANGCTDIENFTLDFVEPLIAEEQIQNVTCPGAADGSIMVELSGGLPPFELRWEQDILGMERTDLAGGNYTYNVSTNGCGFARSVSVFEPQPLTVEFSYSPQTDDFLTAIAYASGGTFPYQYQWSTGGSGMSVSNLLPEESYFLTITDANACVEEWELQPGLTNVTTLEKSELRVYPNPGPGLFQIDHASFFTSDIKYTVHSVSGKVILQGTNVGSSSLQIDLQSEAAGNYILLLCTEEGVFQQLLTKT